MGHRLALSRYAAIACLLALAGCGQTTRETATARPADGWHDFSGSLTAAGNRRIISLGGDRRASVVDLTGSMLLAGPQRPGVGFRADVIAFNDSASGMVGRAVWTDERGDQVFSELKGQGTATGNRIEGMFVGGTGRYAGATGTYQLSWQYVLETEDGAVQGRATGLTGRVRVGGASAEGATK